MANNLLTAIDYLVSNKVFNLKTFYNSNNRANNMGDSLEEYVKDIFAKTLHEKDNAKREKEIGKTFSFLGNTNNPPDAILKHGDAIEVKKIETVGAALALNSSYPKDMLRSSSPMITDKCRNCEPGWIEKDIIYIVGVVNKTKLKKMFIVYGKDYAADYNIYERIKNKIKDGVESIPNVEFSDTKELGHVKKVDPLGITYLRVRGMWGIENPSKAFSYITTPDPKAIFELSVILNTDKYNSFPEEHRTLVENLQNTITGFKINDVEIRDPNNPADHIEAKHILYKI